MGNSPWQNLDWTAVLCPYDLHIQKIASWQGSDKNLNLSKRLINKLEDPRLY